MPQTSRRAAVVLTVTALGSGHTLAGGRTTDDIEGIPGVRIVMSVCYYRQYVTCAVDNTYLHETCVLLAAINSGCI